jgi:hypothetical protein
MAIRFECPHCNHGCKAPEDTAGKKSVCPNCKQEVIIPEKKIVKVPEQQSKPKERSEDFEAEVDKALLPQSKIETKAGQPAIDDSEKHRKKDEDDEHKKAEDDTK